MPDLYLTSNLDPYLCLTPDLYLTCVYLFVFIYLSICLSACLFIYLSIYLTIIHLP